MIRLEGRGATYGEVWFDEQPPADCDVDIVRYHCRPTPVRDARRTPFLSMVTDLGVDTEALAAAFSKDCRYKIRRADTKDNLATEWIMDPAQRLEEFRAFFDTFASQKGHEPCDLPWLRSACNAGQLVLTNASRHDEMLVWHAYVVAGKSTWLQYTGSCYRDRENDYRALVGRANRWLHWQDMLRFKATGMSRYDWGGLFQDESAPDRAGINEFKKSFGGQIEQSYECTVAVSLRGRIVLPLRDAWRNCRSAFARVKQGRGMTGAITRPAGPQGKTPSSGPEETARAVSPRITRA